MMSDYGSLYSMLAVIVAIVTALVLVFQALPSIPDAVSRLPYMKRKRRYKGIGDTERRPSPRVAVAAVAMRGQMARAPPVLA